MGRKGRGRLNGKVIFEFTLEGGRVSWVEGGGGSAKELPADLMGFLGLATENTENTVPPAEEFELQSFKQRSRVITLAPESCLPWSLEERQGGAG